jgi:hypothetical protein
VVNLGAYRDLGSNFSREEGGMPPVGQATRGNTASPPHEPSIGPATAERRAQEGLSATLRVDFLDPDSATCQVQIVRADAATTFDAVRTTDFASSPLVIALSRLRELPDRVLRRMRRRPRRRRAARATVGDLIEAGYWVVLEDRPPRELALGLSMWDERVGEEGQSMERFHSPSPGAVRVGWAFTVESLAPHRSLLITETRTQAVDDPARRRFRLYWRLIAPFAGFTRRLVLRAIAAEAERR